MGNQRQLNGGQQGSGSGLDADTVDATESTDLGSTPDDTTIRDGANGLENFKKDTLIGDFEADMGDWTGTDYTRDDVISGAESSSWFIRAYTSSTGEYTLSRSVDFTSVSDISLYYNVDPGSSQGQTGNSDDQVKVKVGGTTVKTVSLGGSNTDWLQFDAPVSDYTGSQTVELVIDNNSGQELRVGFDKIRAVGSDHKTDTTTDSGAGN